MSSWWNVTTWQSSRGLWGDKFIIKWLFTGSWINLKPHEKSIIQVCKPIRHNWGRRVVFGRSDWLNVISVVCLVMMFIIRLFHICIQCSQLHEKAGKLIRFFLFSGAVEGGLKHILTFSPSMVQAPKNAGSHNSHNARSTVQETLCNYVHRLSCTWQEESGFL